MNSTKLHTGIAAVVGLEPGVTTRLLALILPNSDTYVFVCMEGGKREREREAEVTMQ